MSFVVFFRVFYCYFLELSTQLAYSLDKTSDRPIYTSLDDNEPLRDGTDFILFTGERWIMSYKKKFPDLENFTNNKEDLASYFDSKFHGSFTNYSAVYESEPVYVSSTLDADIKASPLSIRWRSRTGLLKDFVQTEFFCAKCDNTLNSCFNDGVCSNSTCDCPDGYSGSRCEISPKNISDGKCDQNLNEEQFKFDGGDCCEDTCKSTNENICGTLDRGYIDIGYPFCKRDSNQWYLSGDKINGVSSVSRSGHFVALSGSGTILAVSDPGESIVRLFDKDGAEWKQRGQSIQGRFGSHFGSVISLSSIDSNNITHNPRTFPKVILAVGAPKIGLVRVFTCSTDGCIQRGKDIIGGDGFGNSLSVEGDSIAIGGAARETVSQRKPANGEVKVFTWSNDTWEERGSVNFTESLLRKLSDSSPQFRLQGYYVSLSDDYLAVGTLKGELSGPSFESVKLITQVFRWNKYSEIWEQLGNGIEKNFYHDASFGTPWPLKAVVIKRSTLAIGYNASADVYSWDESSNAWTQRERKVATGPEGFVG